MVPSYTYQLTTVAVLRGTMAFAAGGSPYLNMGAFPPCGIIVGTANGGFSWLQQARSRPHGLALWESPPPSPPPPSVPLLSSHPPV